MIEHLLACEISFNEQIILTRSAVKSESAKHMYNIQIETIKSKRSTTLKQKRYHSDLDICGEDVVLVEVICLHVGGDVLLQCGFNQFHHHHLI